MAIKFQYNKTSLGELGKQLKMRRAALPTIKSKESALRSEVKKAKVQQYNPNFKGRDAQRTSPGQLLPGEVPNTRR